MGNKRNAALEAMAHPRAVNVVELPAATPSPAPEAPVAAPAPKRATVANTAARVMLYLPPKVKRKFQEIAFHENCKPHDVYLEALAEYLEKRGHTGLLRPKK